MKKISLVIIDTESYKLATNALELTKKNFFTDDILIFSDDEEKWSGYSIIKIPKIKNHHDYNKIILVELGKFLKTEYALIIQYDGFVINAKEFSDFFLKFDYIGAPWPAGMVAGKEATVGNGGFSLRSKKIINSLIKYENIIDFNVPEDVLICRYLRQILEENDDINFAPVEVARFFSKEFEVFEKYNTFGFHGLHFLPKIYEHDIPFLLDNLPERCFLKNSYQLNFLELGFKTLGMKSKQLLIDKLKKINNS